MNDRPDHDGHLRSFLPYLGIWMLALAARLLFLWQVKDSPMFGLLLGDASSYDAWARQIADGDWLGKTVFYQAPLYPYFLGVTYSLFGSSMLAAKVVQAFIGASSCLLLASATCHWFSYRTGLLCGAVLALYPAAIFADGLIQKSVLDIFLLSALLCVLSQFARSSGLIWSLAGGFILGCLALTRENTLLFAPLIILWLLVRSYSRDETGQLGSVQKPDSGHCSAGVSLTNSSEFCSLRSPDGRRFFGQNLASVAMFTLALACVLLPVAWRNWVVGDTFALTTSQLGPNFYIGNHASADGTYAPLRWGHGHPSFERADATLLAEESLGKQLNPGEVSRYWFHRTVEDIRASPGRWFTLIGRKCLLLMNAAEIGDTEDQYTYSDWSWLLRITGYLLHWGTLLPLAAAGLFITWPRRNELGLLCLLLAGYALSVVLFYVFARYRLPMICFLVPLACTTLLNGRAWLKRKATPQIACCVAVTVLVAAVSNWPLFNENDFRAVTQNSIANALAEDEARLTEAIEHYHLAQGYKADYAAAHFNLGVLFIRTNQIGLAINRLEQAMVLRPNNADIYHQLGVALSKTGRISEAEEKYRRTIELAPNHKGAHNNLGVALTGHGQLTEAARHYVHVLRIDPTDRQAHNNLGTVLARRGQLDKAIMHFDKALSANPEYRDAQSNRGRALAQLGRHDEAADQLASLAAAFAADGQLNQALETAQRALEYATLAGNDTASQAIRNQLKRYRDE